MKGTKCVQIGLRSFGIQDRLARVCGKMTSCIWALLDFVPLLDSGKGKEFQESEEVFSHAWKAEEDMEDLVVGYEGAQIQESRERSEKSIPQWLTLPVVSCPIVSHKSGHLWRPCPILLTQSLLILIINQFHV